MTWFPRCTLRGFADWRSLSRPVPEVKPQPLELGLGWSAIRKLSSAIQNQVVLEGT